MGIRHAAVAGQFYPASAERLRQDVEGYMRAAGVDAAPERVTAIISPHAGYVYSGPTAGYVFARVRGKKPKRVVLLGRSHRYRFDGAAVFESGVFETPLGELPVDEPFAKALAKEAETGPCEAHLPEHGLEVQLPFLQVALGETPIVPVLFGSDPVDWHIRIGKRLAEMLDEDDLVLASTDLSHYLTEEEANRIDTASLERVLSKECASLARESITGACALCGATAVVTAMAYALAAGAEDWRLLDYRTSAAATGDTARVVGYGAISMERVA